VPNPGPGGWGVVLVEAGEIRAARHGKHPKTTNNRMELTALIEAFRLLPDDAEVTVHTDSRLCVDTIETWAPGWERKGWRKKGGEIKNVELVQELLGATARTPALHAPVDRGPLRSPLERVRRQPGHGLAARRALSTGPTPPGRALLEERRPASRGDDHASRGASLLPTIVRFMPIWIDTALPSTIPVVLPFRYHPNEPVENAFTSASIS
jgi:hypothetical protein